MKTIKRSASTCLLAGVLAVVSAQSVAAAQGLCSFTLTGSIAAISCLQEGRTPACVLRVEIWIDDEPMSYEIWCLNQMAQVCETLEPGLPVLVLGEDDGESKRATHIGVWIQPPPVDGTGSES